MKTRINFGPASRRSQISNPPPERKPMFKQMETDAKPVLLWLALLLSTLIHQPSTLLAQGTVFTYQGFLTDNGAPASGIYDLRFTIYDLASAGSVVGGPVDVGDASVSNGLFTVTLDPGAGVFTGPARWLEIGVRPGASMDAFTNVAPRHALLPTPYAIYAGKAMMLDGTLPGSQLAGAYANAVNFDNTANMFTGKFTGDGGMLTNLNALSLGGLTASNFWQTTGNVGTTAGTHFLGTTDNQPLEVKVNNLRALRLEDNGDGGDPGTIPDGAPNIIGGSPGNFVLPGVVGATISGGGTTNRDGITYETNSVHADYGTVSGGVDNQVAATARGATIAGGWGNHVGTNSTTATIAGGNNNRISSSAVSAVIGGGAGNAIESNPAFQSSFSAIVGGRINTVKSFGYCNLIGGGELNTIERNSTYATIAGGTLNLIDGGSNSLANVIGGGQENLIEGPTSYGTIAGGHQNWIQFFADYGAIGGGRFNYMYYSQYGTVAGGLDNGIRNDSHSGAIGGGNLNTIYNSSPAATIGGGERNSITNHSRHATISGGYLNDIGTNSPGGAIGGGQFNSIAANSSFATIGGGTLNRVATNSNFSALGGGNDNSIAAGALYATIAGGGFNAIGASSANGAVGGGFFNRIADLSESATIAGGRDNDIGLRSDYSTVGGGNDNNITGSAYATIAGGRVNDISATSDHSAIGGGHDNNIANNAASAVIAGGAANGISTSAAYSVIGGGQYNDVAANSMNASIAGGLENNIGTNAGSSAIGGGQYNDIADGSAVATIAGGWDNNIGANADYGAIGGGQFNNIAASSPLCTIAGGGGNAIGSGVSYGVVGGGSANSIAANADYAAIPGGRDNEANGDYGFAAGRRAKSGHAGSFVWADSSNFDFSSTVANGFFARAVGGVKFVTGIDGSGGEDAGVRLTAGSSAWTTLSDRRSKTNLAPVNPRAILDRLAAIPIQTWNWKAQTESIRHIGPMAQDFFSAFGVGEDERHISTVDADGVALAAIQGLNQKVEAGGQRSEVRIQKLEAENAELKARLERLEQQMNQNQGGAK